MDNTAPHYIPHSIDRQHVVLQKSLRRQTMIKKVKEGYKVLSEKGKNLGGPYKSKSQAEKRLKQVEYFKHRKG
jgi:phosphosulfolactate synthase (CoM biosynthesis protein A)